MIVMVEPGQTGRPPTQEERTRSWVEERFRELGFTTSQAAALADSGADWHQAENLIIRGARHETVVDLLT